MKLRLEIEGREKQTIYQLLTRNTVVDFLSRSRNSVKLI